MTAWMIIATVVVTVAAAVRSTWSPCGLSMLASITPLSEVERGHRFRTTALWYVTGSLVGGTTLGLCIAALSVGVGAISLTSHEVILVALVASAVAVMSDTGAGRFHLPVHHRQVNERWLDRFRPWVYGVGFGWQIGTGLATYIMTAGVYLMIVLSALNREPWLSFGFGLLFGLVRGLSVCLGRRITSTKVLTEFHRRFHTWGTVVRRVTVAVEAMVTGVFAALLSPWVALAVGAGSLLWIVAWAVTRRPTVVAVNNASDTSRRATLWSVGQRDPVDAVR